MCLPGSSQPVVYARKVRLVDVHEDNDALGPHDMVNPHKISWVSHPLMASLDGFEAKVSPAERAEFELLTNLS